MSIPSLQMRREFGMIPKCLQPVFLHHFGMENKPCLIFGNSFPLYLNNCFPLRFPLLPTSRR